jgi:hypothetical protein
VVIIVYIWLWTWRWKSGASVWKRSWLAWALALMASACSALWALEFLGDSSLGWTVPSLAAIDVTLFALWYSQRNGTGNMTAPSPIGSNEPAPQEPFSHNAGDGSAATPRPAPSNKEGAAVILRISDLTPVGLEDVIAIVAAKMGEPGQVASAVRFCDLSVRFPIASANARQLWEAVFTAALEEDKFITLINYIRGHLDARPKRQLDTALQDIGLKI